MSVGAGGSGAPLRMGADRLQRLLRDGPLSHAAEHYNDDGHFSDAISTMLALKRDALQSLALLPPHATHIDVGKWSLRPAERVQMLCMWVQSNPAATALDLSRCEGLALDGARCLGAALRLNSTLQTLQLGSSAQLPVQELSGHARVRRLNLTHRRYGAIAGVVLSELLAANATVETLDLSANMLGQRDDAGCIALSAALRTLPSLPSARLHTLVLANNYIGGPGALALVDALAQQHATIQTLDLSSNEIGSAAALELASRLLAQSANPIRRLRLQGNGIDAAATAPLVNQLARTGLAIEL